MLGLCVNYARVARPSAWNQPLPNSDMFGGRVSYILQRIFDAYRCDRGIKFEWTGDRWLGQGDPRTFGDLQRFVHYFDLLPRHIGIGNDGPERDKANINHCPLSNDLHIPIMALGCAMAVGLGVSWKLRIGEPCHFVLSSEVPIVTFAFKAYYFLILADLSRGLERFLP